MLDIERLPQTSFRADLYYDNKVFTVHQLSVKHPTKELRRG